MPEFYFDIETNGRVPSENRIVSIQYQRLSGYDGAPESDLVLMKEWESGEEAIVKSFAHTFLGQSNWDFIPIGQNLVFDFDFLKVKFNKYLGANLDLEFLREKPWIDLKSTLVMMNGGSFKGYDRIMGSAEGEGRMVPGWYANKQYDLIEKYVRSEASNFISKYQSLKRQLRGLKL